jgi:Polyketide cyclase / dehydrase and lipid transport
VLHVETSITIGAPRERVWEVYADYRSWPRIFPAVKGVRLIQQEGSKQVLEIDHTEGKVINELVLRPPDQIDLWEVKRRYDALFVNRFEIVGGGSRLSVGGDIFLKGWARLLQPFLRGYVRRQITRLQLQPVKAAAESGSGGGSRRR